MEELALALVVGLSGVNLAATFKILYELGGFKGDLDRLKERVTNLEERSHHELA